MLQSTAVVVARGGERAVRSGRNPSAAETITIPGDKDNQVHGGQRIHEFEAPPGHLADNPSLVCGSAANRHRSRRTTTLRDAFCALFTSDAPTLSEIFGSRRTEQLLSLGIELMNVAHRGKCLQVVFR